MIRQQRPDAETGTAWQSWLLLLVCLFVHYVVLDAFIRHNAYLDRRVLDTRRPFQVDLLAERPADSKPAPADPVARAVATRPRPRPRPVVNPPPKPAEDSAQTQPSKSDPGAAPQEPSTDPSTAAANDPAAGAGNNSQGAAESGGAGVLTAGTSAGPTAQALGGSSDPPANLEPEKTDKDNSRPPAGPLYGVVLPPPPPAGVWTYSVHMGEYNQSGAAGSLKLQFEHDATRYSIQAEVSATGLTALFYGGMRRDVSQGRLTANGLEPMRYAEQRNRRAERTTTIDYGVRAITFAGGETAPLTPGTQDRLSGLFQLGVLARARADLFAPGETVEISEINLRDVERVRYRVEGVEILDAPAGRFRTLYLRRQPVAAGEPTLEVWLDYDAMMIPVRIRLTDRTGRVIDQVIDKKG